ncbi:MAG: GNVR domain-containing protein, partial [Desulfuromonadales bacterium]
MAGMNDQANISTTASRFANAPGAMVDDELDLSRLWRVLIDGGWWIIATTALFALVGVAYALVATPIYQADSLVQVEGKKEATRDFFDRADRYEGENAAKGLAEIEIVRSRLVVGSVVGDLKLDIVVKPKRGFMTIFGTGSNTVSGVKPTKHDFVLAGWRDGEEEIQVDRFEVPNELTDKRFILQMTGLNQFELQFDGETVLRGGANQDLVSADGEIALRLSELQAPEGSSFTLTRLHKLTAVKTIAENLAVTEQGKGSGILKLTLTDSQPRRAAQILNAVTESFLLQNVQRQAVEAEKSLDFLNEKLPEIRVALDNAEQELSGYRTKAESVDLSQEAKAILDQQINLETRINELNVKESELRPLFTREHPNYRSLMEQRGNLESERKRLDRMTQRLPETEQKVLRLTRDVEVYKELYVQLVNRSEELKVVKAGSVGNVRILDRAEVQPKPVAPRKTF